MAPVFSRLAAPRTSQHQEGVDWSKVLSIGAHALPYVLTWWFAVYGVPKAFQACDEYMHRAQKEAKKRLARILGRPHLEQMVLTDRELAMAEDVVDPATLDATFDSIGGLDSQKEEIWDLVILPLQRPDLLSTLGTSRLVSFPKGILLYGPPGTGKTSLAKAIAKESGAAFINMRQSNTQNMWFGEGNKNVAAVYSLAQKLAPSIIFIDEIESFARSRSGASSSLGGACSAHTDMMSEFMALWDGIQSGTDARVLVLGATNRPQDIDPAVQRRMPRVFQIGLPEAEQRKQILEVILRDENLSPDVNIEQLAGRAEGFSGSDLKELCKAAALEPVHELSRSIRQAQRESPRTEEPGERAEDERPPAARPARAQRSRAQRSRAQQSCAQQSRAQQPRPRQPAAEGVRPMCMEDFNKAFQKVEPAGLRAGRFAEVGAESNAGHQSGASTLLATFIESLMTGVPPNQRQDDTAQ